MPKKPELPTSAVPYLTQLGRGVVSVFHGNSRIHDCTFQSGAPPSPGLGASDLGLPGSRSTAWSLLAHFSLDSHFHPRPWGSPKEGCKLSWKAQSRLAFHRRAIAAGGSVAWRARSCCSGRAGAGTRPRAPTARSRGTATLGAASPLLRGLAAAHYPAAGHLPAGSGTPDGFGELPKKPGRRGEGDPRLRLRGGRERARESRSGAALHAEVSLLDRLEF